jgi:hypothetical protein
VAAKRVSEMQTKARALHHRCAVTSGRAKRQRFRMLCHQVGKIKQRLIAVKLVLRVEVTL